MADRCITRDAVGQQCLRPSGHADEFTNWFGQTCQDPNGAHDFGGVYPDSKRAWEWTRLGEEAESGG